MIHNRHERKIAASVGDVGMLIDSLAGQNDRLWPRKAWPAMRLDGPLGVGAAGGHGPVHYFVTHYEPGRRVEFQFTKPAGFKGRHSFTAVGLSKNSTLLRHELSMSPSGTALFTWPLFFRPCMMRSSRKAWIWRKMSAALLLALRTVDRHGRRSFALHSLQR